MKAGKEGNQRKQAVKLIHSADFVRWGMVKLFIPMPDWCDPVAGWSKRQTVHRQ